MVNWFALTGFLWTRTMFLPVLARLCGCFLSWWIRLLVPSSFLVSGRQVVMVFNHWRAEVKQSTGADQLGPLRESHRILIWKDAMLAASSTFRRRRWRRRRRRRRRRRWGRRRRQRNVCVDDDDDDGNGPVWLGWPTLDQLQGLCSSSGRSYISWL